VFLPQHLAKAGHCASNESSKQTKNPLRSAVLQQGIWWVGMKALYRIKRRETTLPR
jgi:hypothetical protein